VKLVDRVRGAVHQLAQQNASTPRLALGVGIGVLVGATPFYGFHLLIGALLGRVLRINQLAIFLGEQIALPFIAPFLAFACIQTGHLVLEGRWLEHSELKLSVEAARAFFEAWLVGGVVFGALLGVTLGGVSYGLLRLFRKER